MALGGHSHSLRYKRAGMLRNYWSRAPDSSRAETRLRPAGALDREHLVGAALKLVADPHALSAKSELAH